MKVGIFAGLERPFPAALIDRLNRTRIAGEAVTAELIQIGAVREAPPRAYDLIVDRISHEIYLYRTYCKVAALAGTYVINNPFWFCADDKYFGYSLARRLGVVVPKTMILPSKAYPRALTPFSFRNLVFPLDWDAVFQEIGFPAFLKQHAGGGWANVHKVHDPGEFFAAYDQSGELVMMLQEAIDFDLFVRCQVIGQRHVFPMVYDPHRRCYLPDAPIPEAIGQRIAEEAARLTGALGYDMNSAEFACRDGVPYAIDFTNPGPDFEPANVGARCFEWVIDRFLETITEVLEAPAPPQPPLRWRDFLDGDGGSRPRQGGAA